MLLKCIIIICKVTMNNQIDNERYNKCIKYKKYKIYSSHLVDHLLDKLHQDLCALLRKILVTPRELESFLGLINFSSHRYLIMEDYTCNQCSTG